jgi:hypothetical protein
MLTAHHHHTSELAPQLAPLCHGPPYPPHYIDMPSTHPLSLIAHKQAPTHLMRPGPQGRAHVMTRTQSSGRQ